MSDKTTQIKKTTSGDDQLSKLDAKAQLAAAKGLADFTRSIGTCAEISLASLVHLAEKPKESFVYLAHLYNNALISNRCLDRNGLLASSCRNSI